IAVRSEYAAKADIVRDEEFSGGGAVVRIGPMKVAFVVAIGRLGRGIHDRPIRVVPEQEVRILSQLFYSLPTWRRDESLAVVLAGDVPQLEWIAAAKRNLSAAMQHLAAEVEVLVDDDHRCAKVPRPNGSGQAGAASSDDDDVGLVGPWNGLRGRNLS